MNGKRYSRSVIWAILIFILCAIPGHSIPEPDFLRWLKWDKLTHLFLFGIQAWLLLKEADTRKTRRTFLLLTLVVAYGGLIEFLQTTLFIGRNGDIRDAIANSIGVLAGWYVYRRSHRTVQGDSTK